MDQRSFDGRQAETVSSHLRPQGLYQSSCPYMRLNNGEHLPHGSPLSSRSYPNYDIPVFMPWPQSSFHNHLPPLYQPPSSFYGQPPNSQPPFLPLSYSRPDLALGSERMPFMSTGPSNGSGLPPLGDYHPAHYHDSTAPPNNAYVQGLAYPPTGDRGYRVPQLPRPQGPPAPGGAAGHSAQSGDRGFGASSQSSSGATSGPPPEFLRSNLSNPGFGQGTGVTLPSLSRHAPAPAAVATPSATTANLGSGGPESGSAPPGPTFASGSGSHPRLPIPVPSENAPSTQNANLYGSGPAMQHHFHPSTTSHLPPPSYLQRYPNSYATASSRNHHHRNYPSDLGQFPPPIANRPGDFDPINAPSIEFRRRGPSSRARRAMSRVHHPAEDEDRESDDEFDASVAEQFLREGLSASSRSEAHIRAVQFFRGSVSSKPVASPDAIRSLETVDVNEVPEGERNCVICYNEYGVATPEGVVETPVRIPNCKHIFGDHCIKKWLEDSDSCPYCRCKLPSERRIMTNSHALNNFLRLRGGSRPPNYSGQMPQEILLRIISRGDDGDVGGNAARRSPPIDISELRRRTRPRHAIRASSSTDHNRTGSLPTGSLPSMGFSSPTHTTPPRLTTSNMWAQSQFDGRSSSRPMSVSQANTNGQRTDPVNVDNNPQIPMGTPSPVTFVPDVNSPHTPGSFSEPSGFPIDANPDSPSLSDSSRSSTDFEYGPLISLHRSAAPSAPAHSRPQSGVSEDVTMEVISMP